VAWVKTHPNWQKKAFDAEAEVKRRAATAAAAKVPHVAAQRVPEFAILPADHMIDGREGDSHSFSSYELEKYRWLCIVQHAILMAKEAGKKCTCPSVVITNDFAVRKDVERVLKAAKYGVMVVIGGREDDTTGGSCVIFRISWR